MNLETFHHSLEQDEARGYPLNDEQRRSVAHGHAPLWLLAGPGSGKTEVLVTRTLKLICVDGVDPASILVTTFTKKAARNLEDRLSSYLIVLQHHEPDLRDIDLADLRVGTLHGLCNDIMQAYRYPGYQNVRLMDDVEQALFMYRHADIVDDEDTDFWGHFDYLFTRWRPSHNHPPNRWERARAAITLFNRLVEDLVDVDRLSAAEPQWAQLVMYYRQYRQELESRYRCDYAHLLVRFTEFLDSPHGQRFLDGDGDTQPPLRYVMVDEYQDTNPIQERIYLALAANEQHNLTVVGDDDQALYRFRGGTVACMVSFDQACLAAWKVTPAKIQLTANYRSHPQIVDFFNTYIASFPEMQAPGVRAPGKQPVIPASDIKGDYPAVNWITTRRAGDLGNAVADLIADHLLADGIIQDLSQCVILLRSTKDSPRNAGPFIQALRDRGIPIYNPRSKSFMEAEEVLVLLYTLISVIDPDGVYRDIQSRNFNDTLNEWRDTLQRLLSDPHAPTEDLIVYRDRSREALRDRCADQPGASLNLSLLEIIYRILSLAPFPQWRRDPERNLRLAKVTRLFEGYHSLNLDSLWAAQDGRGVDPGFLRTFYHTFLTYLIQTGIDDDEDEEVVVPRGRLPIMTIHQAKGLEFPFVIVGQLGTSWGVGPAHILETELSQYRQTLYHHPIRPPEQLALEDDIRLFYVAYSRAQYSLTLVGTRAHFERHVAVPGCDFTAFRRTYTLLQ